MSVTVPPKAKVRCHTVKRIGDIYSAGPDVTLTNNGDEPIPIDRVTIGLLSYDVYEAPVVTGR
jgi:hypothetical protein